MKTNTRKAALIFIFITVLLDVIGLGIIIPVVPSLIIELTGKPVGDAALYGGALMFVYAFTQFLFAPVIGSLSDRFGRRPVILFSLFGYGINYILMALAPTVFWLFMARFVSGITGATMTTASAYVADISPPEKKAQNFGLIGAAFGLGFIIGPVVGGLLGEYGSRIPFYAAAVLTLINVAYGAFVLPESLSKDDRRSFDINRANPVGSLKQIRSFPAISGLIGVFFLIYLSQHATQSTWTYYTMYKFEWDEGMIGISLGVVGFFVALVQGGLTRFLIPKMGEKNAVYVGLAFSAIGFVGFGFAPTGLIMLSMILPYCMGGLSGPALQSIISNKVPANQQGELQGALTSLVSFTAIFGPPLMTNLFSFFSAKGSYLYIPGAPFLVAALFIIIALILTIKAFNGVQSAQKY